MTLRHILRRFLYSPKRIRRPNQPSKRSLALERLEDRALPAATLFLDFGFGFPNGQLTISNNDMAMNGVNGPQVFGASHTLISLTRTIQNQNIDLNSDGQFNQADAQVLANQIVSVARRSYEVFDVTIQTRSAASINDVRTTLASVATNDAYVFVAGDDPATFPAFGVAPLDVGNARDNTAFTFADEMIRSLSAAQRVTGLARTAAHEAAHTFGLEHTNGSSVLATGDEMGAPQVGQPDLRNFGVVHLFSRFPLPFQVGAGTQNNHSLLASNVGLRAGAPAYITGTGAFDRITITRSPAIGNASVVVQPFADANFTIPLGGPFSYPVSLINGLLVEAGFNSDRIIVDGNLGATTVTVRGGSGTDTVTVNGTVNADLVTVTTTDVRLLGTIVTFAEVENLTIDTVGGNDVINVQGTADGVATIVRGGGGNDTINVGSISNSLGSIRDLTVQGEGDSDTLNLNDHGFIGSDTYTLTASTLRVAGLPDLDITYDTMQAVRLNGAGGANTFHIRSTPVGCPVTVNGGGGNDTFNVGSGGVGSVLSGVVGMLTLDGLAGADVLNLDDRGLLTAATYVLQTVPNVIVQRSGTAEVRYASFATLNLFAGSGNDTIAVQRLAWQTATNIFAGAGNDAIILGQAGSLDWIHSPLLLDGQAGADTLTINDQTDPNANLYTVSQQVTDTRVQRRGLAIVDNPVDLRYRAVETCVLNASGFGDEINLDGTAPSAGVLTVNAGPGNDLIRVRATRAGTTTNVGGGADNDVIHVGNAANSLADIDALVTVNGDVGSDNLYVNDQAAAAATSYTVSPLAVTATGVGAINYSLLEQLVLNAGAGGDSVTVSGTAAATATTVWAWGGNDTITVQNNSSFLLVSGGLGDDTIMVQRTGSAMTADGEQGNDIIVVGGAGFSLSGILGAVRVDGDVGSDRLIVSDQAAVGAHSFVLAGNSLTRNGLGIISAYFAVDTLTFTAGGQADSITVQGPTAGGTTVNAGGGDDTIAMSPVAAPGAVRVDGQGGTNRLSYAAYTGDVLVNLPLGTATDVSGGIANIQNVTGGSGNDVLAGDQHSNVLDGGAGSDILIGGGLDFQTFQYTFLADVLQGGGGEDILIAGWTVYEFFVPDVLPILRDIWALALPYAQRIGFLSSLLDPGTAVFSSWAASTLTGGTEDDWFFANDQTDNITDLSVPVEDQQWVHLTV